MLYWNNSITVLGLFYINNSLRTILSDTRTGIKTIGFFCPQHPNWDQNLQFPPLNQHPASRACFRLHHFEALEKDCLSGERSLLNMRYIWYTVSNPWYVGSVMTIGLPIWRILALANQCDERKLIDSSRSSGCGDFKCLTRFSQSEPINCALLYIHRLQVMIGLLADLSVFRLTRATTLAIGFTTLNWSSDSRTSTWLMSDLTKSHL